MDSDWRRQVMWEAFRCEKRNLKKPANEHLTQTKCQGNRLIVRRVRADTKSFHAWYYPPHEKSTAFPDGKNITPLPQNSLASMYFHVPAAFFTRRFVMRQFALSLLQARRRRVFWWGCCVCKFTCKHSIPAKNRCFASARRIDTFKRRITEPLRSETSESVP